MRHARYMTGILLDVGSGDGGRYQGLFPCAEHKTMDVHPGEGIDIVARAEKIPLPDADVDSIVCTQVFEHVDHPFESAAELFRILKPGGYVLLTAPQMNELHEEPNDFFRYTNFGLQSLFEGAGFEVVVYEQRGGFYTTRAQMLIRYLIDRLKLYERAILGKILGKLIWVYGKFMMKLDDLDAGTANRKNTLGWCFVFQKPK